jgi:uncharacterized protein (TIGR02679 family)
VTADVERIRRLLGGPETAWLVERVRKRLESGGRLEGRVTLQDPTVPQRRAVARLLGRQVTTSGALSVRLEDVDQVVRRSGAAPGGLGCAVVSLTGPVIDRAAQRAAGRRAWAEVFAALDAAVVGRPELTEWADGLRRTGTLRRLATDTADMEEAAEVAAGIVAGVTAVLRALPAADEPVGVFARRTLGRAHALNEDQPLARLLLPAVAILAGRSGGHGAAWRRDVWAGVGVLRDDLSSTVLVLGLPGDDTSVTGRVLAACAEAGQPAVLTLRQLVQDSPRPDIAGRRVSVCEGPVVVSAAADRLGRRSGPLVCTNGQPGVATMRLLRLLADAGAQLRYHGDFDWGGVRIANRVFDRLRVLPWRFDTAAYRAGAASELAAPLRGRPAVASWDADLSDAMVELGRQVEEEAVLDGLLADLEDSGR